MKHEKLVIIGSGPAGLTAAIYAARADLNPLVLEGKQPGGQLMGTTEIENWPGATEGMTGPILMNMLREQAKKFGARTEFKYVEKVDFSNPDELRLWIGTEEITADAVIIATGASARWLDLGKGEERFWGKGYSACATCDGAFFRGKTVAVVGGGDSACEEAMFLTKFAEKVYQLVRRDEMRASKPMIQRVMDNPKIEVIWNTAPTELKGEMKLEAVEIKDRITGEVKDLPIDGLFVAIGHTPNTVFLEENVELDRGFIKIHDHTKTNIPSVFVGGDVADPHYQQAVVAAGSGCKAALDAEAYLASKE
jgi:thioredoxin reductase (NADPH)